MTIVSDDATSVYHYEPFFCPDGKDPYDTIKWSTRDVVLKNVTGNTVFSQSVEAPVTWSDRAVCIVAQKYFYGKLGTPQRENSIKQLINRVVDTIYHWAVDQGYCDMDGAEALRNDLAYLLVNQYGAFNSPVFFNLGIKERRPQVSACFINFVEDNMESIAALQATETAIFKGGSGSGVNLSTLRGSMEHLSNGGLASGPVSFMKGYDAWAGAIKSGGATRRAAAIRILNDNHPDILEFIECKSKEEHIAQLLVKAGLSADFDDPNGAYAKINFQNANHSVRLSDAFMKKVVYALENPNEEALWELKAVKTGGVVKRVPILTLWKAICDAAWSCGDPGIQFDDAINNWHTCSNDGKQVATNPCGEFSFLNDSACNLASLNLMKFRQTDGQFDAHAFRYAVQAFIIAQEIVVNRASYPTQKIMENSKRYRPLGLGYTNLGALLMSKGLAYDSDEGRNLAAYITSIMTSTAYHASARIAAHKGPFDAYKNNKESMLNIIKLHRDDALKLQHEKELMNKGVVNDWDTVLALGEKYGFRNAQVTLLAPTGTISFMMDCDTTGIEPELSLYKTKQLVGGGTLVMENRIVDMALEALGYEEHRRNVIKQHLHKDKHLEYCPDLLEKHSKVFQCAFAAPGLHSLSSDAHLLMCAAVQPFLSGAISKTINLPNNAVPHDISNIYIKAWQKGLKSVTIYRDNCKQSQPLITTPVKKVTEVSSSPSVTRVTRRKLNNYQSNMHRIRFAFGEVKGYVLVTPYEDTGMPGEIFVKLSKEGSTISGLVDGWAKSISYNLQYGVPLGTLVKKFSYMNFTPSGYSPDPDIKFAYSIYDAIMRKLAAVFIIKNDIEEEGTKKTQNEQDLNIDGPPCTICGSLMQRSGACYSCPVCGETSGCG